LGRTGIGNDFVQRNIQVLDNFTRLRGSTDSRWASTPR
jgi:hypothetical protein